MLTSKSMGIIDELKRRVHQQPFQEVIRDQIFSVDRLQQYAKYLAAQITVTKKIKFGKSLLPRVSDNNRQLIHAYKIFSKSVEKGQALPPAAEWLIDNFHIIEDQIREIKEDLPEKFYLELPKLSSGELALYPRVYALALGLISHTDSHIEAETLKRFINEFQNHSPLTTGEIWAIAIVLRIALVENLKRIIQHVLYTHQIVESINLLADEILNEVEGTDKDRNFYNFQQIEKCLGLSEVADSCITLQLLRRLRDQDLSIHPICEILDYYIADRNKTLEQILQAEHQFQASAQVTVGNIITSMRLISNMDWDDFFETVNQIDPILSHDPANAYKKMDFSSRDRYRHVIERIAKKTNTSEIKVAEACVKLAQDAENSLSDDPRRSAKSHIGFYLIDKGVSQLEKLFNYKLSFYESFIRNLYNLATTYYFVSLAFLIAIGFSPLAFYLDNLHATRLEKIFVFLISLFPIADSSIAILNLIVNRMLPPKILAKIDLNKEIPDEAKTFVIIPTLFSSESSVVKIIDFLETRYLSNPDKNLYFAILSDFSDSLNKIEKSDQFILDLAKQKIKELNNRYKNVLDPDLKFYLFHRERQWNNSENKWMGWERKRGKLQQFNKFLRGQIQETSFIEAPIFSSFFLKIKYVITLDSDTHLPRGAAKKLIGTILHPLNRPLLNSEKNQIISGYGILQPRISMTPESSARSLFSRIFSGNTGIDPYTKAVSDVYQDLFGEGIFTGKGLYVVDSFESVMAGRIPENTLLSHDLFEGLFCRTALVTDIEFLDDYPTHYEVFAKRQHRWTRGDWQLLRWFPQKSLSVISHWKIIDNLRRSLVAPFVLLWLVLGWTVLPGSAAVWTISVLIFLALPSYAHATNSILFHSGDIPWTSHFWNIWGDFKTNTLQIGLYVACMAHQAYLQTDAILRTLYRICISNKNLLQWVSAAEEETKFLKQNRLSNCILASSILISIFTLVFVSSVSFQSFWIASVFSVIWFFYPWLARWISHTKAEKKYTLNIYEIQMLRLIARKTWNFFETFNSENDHWLIPDNFQEEPKPTIAHRTSPTNIGLLMLSTCSAYDFGYITALGLAERLEKTLSTLLKLEQYRGHFYNWYDTESLVALSPKYISTVDSGNLAGHLIAVKQTCLEIVHCKDLSANLFFGLKDTLLIVDEKINSFKIQNQISYFDEIINKIKTLLLKLDHRADASAILKDYESIHQEILKLKSISTNELAPIYQWSQKFLMLAEEMNQYQIKSLTNGLDLNLKKRFQNLADLVHDIFNDMDFAFLFDQQRKVFTIGYNVVDGRLDTAFYDLLASESRLASFVAISKGNIPQSHWFHLGRQMTSLFQKRSLVSWSASMFEYLMPLLVMKNYSDSLLHETHLSVIHQQKFYSDSLGIPWGISESGYNARDLQMNYQYGPFGVPGLGLKRGLRDDLVISPYSTFLAILVSAPLALKNLKRLIKDDLLTDFGFYEAVDYTKNRLPPQQTRAVIKSFMAHHQGMILVALNNALHDGVMQNRFHKDETIRCSELLLQERVPKKVVMSQLRAEDLHSDLFFLNKTKSALRQIPDVQTHSPVTQVLSNGKYTVLLTAAGSGFSRLENTSLTRWQEDSTRDCCGLFFYIHDQRDNLTWSATKQPLRTGAHSYSAIFTEHKAEFRCENDICKTLTEVVVSVEDNVEVRRLTLTNLTDQKRYMDVTSYLEPLLTSLDADLAHPAFSNLFIETEFIQSKNALLVHRRQRSATDQEYWGIHSLTVDLVNDFVNIKTGTQYTDIQYETSRELFLGRGQDSTSPISIESKQKLSNTHGFVLDPCLSLRKTLTLEPRATVKVSFILGIAASREEALKLLDKYHVPNAFVREEEMAWTREQMDLRHLNITAQESEVFQTLCGPLIFSNKLVRPRIEVLQNQYKQQIKSQSALWNYGLSGDLPIILVEVSRMRDSIWIKQLLKLQNRLRMKNIFFDLVFIAKENSGYRLDLSEAILQQIRAAGEGHRIQKSAGLFLFQKNMLPDLDWVLLQNAARIHFDADQFSLSEIAQRLHSNERAVRSVFRPAAESTKWKQYPLKIPELQFKNGFGGFSTDGKQYIIHLKNGKTTPLPWVNVIANDKDFGFLISELGSPYTWSGNSRENRLTPWNNDPVCDSPGEIIYIQDKKTQELWSPTPCLRSEHSEYLVSHGQGFTRFDQISHEIETQLTLFVPMDEELKITKLTIKNKSHFPRTLQITSYTEWVLGSHRSKTAHTVVTKKGELTNLFLAQNFFSVDFSERVAYVASSEKVTSFTCDRKSFLGRHGHFRDPLGLRAGKLSGEIGAGWDPCVAMNMEIVLRPGESKEIVLLLGQEVSESSIKSKVEKFLNLQSVQKSFAEIEKFWSSSLTKLTIETPFPEMDILVNHWLLYQTLVCRVWGRSGFYQSGGAVGFRDQLQDAMALIYVDAELAKSQICKAAAHQFSEGDVLHWWHPPKSKGVRTHFSDDLLWLPFVVSFYIEATEDFEILNNKINFLVSEKIPDGQEDIYFQPVVSDEVGTLYEHCARSIDRSLFVGQHGLPLMGTGDWNDGMNRVGHGGKGESVWMAWFLGSVIENFLPYCKINKDHLRIKKYQDHVSLIQASVEKEGWDGNWYKRAFYDDGMPLGSNQNEECKIDSLVQSWAALSKLGNLERTKTALQSVEKYLVNRSEKLIQLFTPAFNKSLQDPGYIKGYVPGVRENGGQYTHAAIWVAMAHAEIGEGDKAIEFLNMLNPINHSSSASSAKKYKIEPYVIAADIYATFPYIGRGGWSWYTGSAGWYYRAYVESILGIQLHNASIQFNPVQAATLPKFKFTYKYKSSLYEVLYENKTPHANVNNYLKLTVDGILQKNLTLSLIDDGLLHQVKLILTESSNYLEDEKNFFQN